MIYTRIDTGDEMPSWNARITATKAGRQVVTYKHGAIIRSAPANPERLHLEQERAVQSVRLEMQRNPEFRTFNRSNLSKKQRNQADALKKSMKAYAEKYGTSNQVKAIEKMNSAKIMWLLGHDVIIVEEFFEYTPEDSFDNLMGKGTQASVLQRYIDSYNALMG